MASCVFSFNQAKKNRKHCWALAMRCTAAEKQAIWRCGKECVYFDFLCRNCGADQRFVGDSFGVFKPYLKQTIFTLQGLPHLN